MGDTERVWCAQLDDMPQAFVRAYLRHRERGPDADTIAFAWIDRGRSVSVDVFADGRVEIFVLDGDTTTDGRDTLSCVSTTSIRALIGGGRFCGCDACQAVWDAEMARDVEHLGTAGFVQRLTMRDALLAGYSPLADEDTDE